MDEAVRRTSASVRPRGTRAATSTRDISRGSRRSCRGSSALGRDAARPSRAGTSPTHRARTSPVRKPVRLGRSSSSVRRGRSRHAIRARCRWVRTTAAILLPVAGNARCRSQQHRLTQAPSRCAPRSRLGRPSVRSDRNLAFSSSGERSTTSRNPTSRSAAINASGSKKPRNGSPAAATRAARPSNAARDAGGNDAGGTL